MPNLIELNIGRYKILGQLGEGGMAFVFRAHDSRLERDVAIKLIQIDESTNKKVIKQFEKESRALAKLNHPNIIPILDFGKTPEWLYIVMPLVEGGTLKDLLGTPIPAQEAAALLSPIAKALAYAHDQNIIHRDVKPSNILISNTGTPMLSDFGIAKLLEESETIEMTGTLQSAGTPDYMAPECGLGLPATPSSDIYSLGVILFEMITGKKPFTGDSPLAIIHKHAYDTLPQPSSSSREIPSFMNGVIYNALAKQPDQRYSSMESFASVLEKISIEKKVHINAPQPSSQKSIKQRKLTAIWVSLLLVMVVAGGLFVVDLQTGSKLQMSIGVISPTPTITLTPTPSPTATPLPTATVPPPTATPTVAYPVDIGTPYPQSGEVISPDNIDRLTLLSQGGYGVPLLVSYSMDGKQLFVCTTNGIVVYDTQNYLKTTFIKSELINLSCAFSKSKYYMATMNSGTSYSKPTMIQIVDLLNNSFVTRLGNDHLQKNMSFSPDGEYLIADVDSGTALWKVEPKQDGEYIYSDFIGTIPAKDGVFSADNLNIITANTQNATYWNRDLSFKKSKFLSVDTNLQFSQDGTLIIGTYQPNKKLGVFSSIDFSEKMTVQLKESFGISENISEPIQNFIDTHISAFITFPEIYTPISISQDNSKVAIANIGGKILIYETSNGKLIQSIDENFIWSMDFSASGNQLAFSSINDQVIKIYNLDQSNLLVLPNFHEPIRTIAISENSSILEISVNTNYPGLSLGDLYSGFDIKNNSFIQSSESPTQNKYLYYSSIESSYFQGYLNILVPNNPLQPENDTVWKRILENSKMGNSIQSIISYDNKFMAINDGYSVELWEKKLTTSKSSEDSRRLIYYHHGLDYETNKYEPSLPLFSPDSLYFADVKDLTATIWRLDDFLPIIEIEHSKGYFRFSDDSKYVAWIPSLYEQSDHKEIEFYKTIDGSLISRVPISSPDEFVLSPDWTICIVNRTDWNKYPKISSTLDIYQVDNGSHIRSIKSYVSNNFLMIFSSDQKYLLTSEGNGDLSIWGIPK